MNQAAAFLLDHFNSIKVQLELFAVVITSPILIFQFHKGTIRTLTGAGKPFVIVYFNSIKVQLELYAPRALPRVFFISIP